MAFALDSRAIEMLCDGMSDGVLLFRHERVAMANDGACGLLGTTREFLMGADVDEVLGRMGLPAPWVMRLRAGDSVTAAPSGSSDTPLRLRWLHLPDEADAELAVLVVHDVRLSRALRRTEEQLASVGQGAAPATTARPPLPFNEVLAYLSSEVRRSHLDLEELSVLVVEPSEASEAEMIATTIAAHLRGADRVGLVDASDRPGGADGAITIVRFPADRRAHVIVVLPCTTAPGRDALAMRLGAALASDGRAQCPIGAATLEVLAPSRRPLDRPRDGARALLERALADLARQSGERLSGRAA
jgi:hypothetical protein